MGVNPATVCSDLLKPGGYGRWRRCSRRSPRRSRAGTTDLACWSEQRQTRGSRRRSRLGRAPARGVHSRRGHRALPPSRQREASREVDHELEMFGCVACNFCVTVCPNDAFFNIKSLDGMEGRQQYLLFTELCNECGNCMTFCPEDGDPAQIKPRSVHRSRALRRPRGPGLPARGRPDRRQPQRGRGRVDLVQRLARLRAGNPLYDEPNGPDSRRGPLEETRPPSRSAPHNWVRSHKDEPASQVVDRLIALDARGGHGGCELVVFPELALTTFFPRWYVSDDDLELDSFYETEMPARDTQPLFDEAKQLGIGFCPRLRRTHRPTVHRYNTPDPRRTRRVDRRQVPQGPPARSSRARTVARVPTSGAALLRSRPTSSRLCTPSVASSAWRHATIGAGPRPTVPGASGRRADPHRLQHADPLRPRSRARTRSRRSTTTSCMQAGAYQNGCFVVGVAKGGTEEGVESLADSCIIAPTGQIVALTAHHGDELHRRHRPRPVRRLQGDALPLRPLSPARAVPAHHRPRRVSRPSSTRISTRRRPHMTEFTSSTAATSAVGDHEHLLAALRDELGVMSPKDGCSPSGSAAAARCSSTARRGSRARPAMEKVDGPKSSPSKASTTTSATDGRGLRRHGALQCGFCTPGIVMRTKAMLDKKGSDSPATTRLDCSAPTSAAAPATRRSSTPSKRSPQARRRSRSRRRASARGASSTRRRARPGRPTLHRRHGARGIAARRVPPHRARPGRHPRHRHRRRRSRPRRGRSSPAPMCPASCARA